MTSTRRREESTLVSLIEKEMKIMCCQFFLGRLLGRSGPKITRQSFIVVRMIHAERKPLEAKEIWRECSKGVVAADGSRSGLFWEVVTNRIEMSSKFEDCAFR
jgi:hypothetical protein